MTDEAQPETSLGSALLNLPIYPLKGPGRWLLFGGTLSIWLISVLSFIPCLGLVLGFFIGIYVLALFRSIISSTADGEDHLPNWPDSTDIFSEIFRPSFMLLVPIAICFLPASSYNMYSSAQDPIIHWSLLGLGWLYLPMALLAVTLYDSILAMNPILVVRSILRIPMDYMMVVAVLGVVVVLSHLLDTHVLDKVPMIDGLMDGFMFIFEGAMLMRAIGLLYRMNEQELGWFYRPKGLCRECGYDLRATIAANRDECPECGAAI